MPYQRPPSAVLLDDTRPHSESSSKLAPGTAPKAPTEVHRGLMLPMSDASRYQGLRIDALAAEIDARRKRMEALRLVAQSNPAPQRRAEAQEELAGLELEDIRDGRMLYEMQTRI